MALPVQLPDSHLRCFPRSLPAAWWTLPGPDLANRLQNMVWPAPMPAHETGPMLERMVHHHPRLVPHAMRMGLRPQRWRRTLDDLGQPQDKPGTSTSTLLFLLEHGDAPMVDQALSHRLELDSGELQRWPSLPLAVLTLSRMAPPDSILGRWTGAQRLDRERAILQVLREHERPGLGAGYAGATLTDVVRQNSPDPVLAALLDHGVNPESWVREAVPRGAGIALRELIHRGDVGELDRFLRWGLPCSQGPGDDQAALEVIAATAPRFAPATPGGTDPEESPEGWAQRQLALLVTLEQHGWVPGPHFRDQAVRAAMRASTDPTLLPHLFARGADPFARDEQGNTALHSINRLTTGLGNLLALLDKGLDPLATNAAGQTALGRFQEEHRTVNGPAGTAHATAIVAMERVVLTREGATDGPAPNAAPPRPRARL